MFRKPSTLYFLPLLFLAGLGVTVFLICSCGTTPQPFFQLYFQNQQIREVTYQFIENANLTLDICVYDIEDERILSLIERKIAQGVVVRVVTEKDNRAVISTVKGLQGIVVDGDDGLMHCKYMISDSKTLWGGSTNLTQTSLDIHYNDVFLCSDQDILQRFENHFEKAYRNEFKSSRKSDEQKGIVFFSPEDQPFEQLMDFLSKAKEEVMIGIYALSDYRIAHFLKVLSAHGVRILIFVDKDWNLNNPYSQSEEIADYTVLRYDRLEAGLMHQKFIIVDAKTVLFGSYNFTGAAETKNDEFFIISSHPAVVQSYRDRFLELWATG